MGYKVINSEKELKKWFEKNFEKLGYTKIIRKDEGVYPDFILLKNKREVKVELETQLSHFLLHKHNVKEVDEIVCVEKDIKLELGIPIIQVRELKYVPRVARLSATVEPDTIKTISKLIKNPKYRNKSHVIETAIKLLEDFEEKQK